MNLVERTETIINLHLSGKTNEEIQAVINIVFPGFQTDNVNYLKRYLFKINNIILFGKLFRLYEMLYQDIMLL